MDRSNLLSMGYRLIVLVLMVTVIDNPLSRASSYVYTQDKTTTTVILIRHAERDNFFNITEEGRERANALVDAVAGMGISAIYSPDLSRNLETVKPLANHLQIEITLIPRLSKTSVDHIVSLILNNNKGEVVLVVGNGSGNLRLLHQRLGGKGDGPYQYGELYMYHVSDGGLVMIEQSKFGS